jgi:hypothetical protein
MLKKMIPLACLTAMLGFSLPATAAPQVTDAVKKTGQAVGDAGKKAAQTTVDVSKKVGSETKHAVTGAPKGVTGKCKDGTYTRATFKSSACAKHGGVRQWY